MKEKTGEKSIWFFQTNWQRTHIFWLLCHFICHMLGINASQIKKFEINWPSELLQENRRGRAWSEQVWSEVTKLHRHPETVDKVYMLYVEELKWIISQYKKKVMLNDFTTELFFLTWMVLCSQQLSKNKKKTNKTRRKDACPAGLIKYLWLSPVYAELVFMSAICSVKQRAKCEETIFFSVEENIPFSKKN